jgi:hypothetical protein
MTNDEVGPGSTFVLSASSLVIRHLRAWQV